MTSQKDKKWGFDYDGALVLRPVKSQHPAVTTTSGHQPPPTSNPYTPEPTLLRDYYRRAARIEFVKSELAGAGVAIATLALTAAISQGLKMAGIMSADSLTNNLLRPIISLFPVFFLLIGGLQVYDRNQKIKRGEPDWDFL